MRVPVTWLREYADVPADATGAAIAADLVKVGLEEEALHGGDITGPLVVGRVLDMVEEPQRNGKVIRWCHVDVGANGQRLTDGTPQGIVCGARNFAVGDLVVVVLPGAVLPGGFEISARRTYGHLSAGMICSAKELGIGEDHDGIVVLGELLADSADLLAALEPGQDAIALLGLAEQVVEVTITPDRGYCFSMRGIAREYSHSTGATFRDPARVEAAPEPNDDGYAVELRDRSPIDRAQGCDRYVARVVRGVDASAASPRWLARRLTESGMRPISLAVDVTNYVMLALGQPLHAFDLARLGGPIVVRRADPEEHLTTLDGVDRTLDPQDLLITDSGRTPLAIAGVMGGATSEVGSQTTDLLIEAAHFEPVTIARSSRRHKLVTEASKRYERGVDPQIAPAAAQLVVAMLVEMGGGVADPGCTDIGSPPAPRTFVLDPQLPARLVGVPYPSSRVVAILREIGAAVGEPDDVAMVSVRPPSWRPDLLDGADCAEEVARIEGYAHIPSVLPSAPGGRGLTHGQRVRRIVADILAARGLAEVLTHPFVAGQIADDLQLPAGDPRRQMVQVANPLSEQAPYLRTTVLSTLLDALRRNVSRGARDVGLYELGLVVLPAAEMLTVPVPGVDDRPDEELLARIYGGVPPQPRHVALVLSGQAEQAGWWGAGRPVDWSDAVALSRQVGRACGLDLEVSQVEHAPWHPGRCAQLSLTGGEVVGYAGELDPKALAALGLPARCCAAELDVDLLTAASDRVGRAAPLSTYPIAYSEVALVVDEATPSALVEQSLRGGADLLESLALLDVYRGEQVGEGSKSLAYRLALRAPDRTLTSAEVNQIRDSAVAAASAAAGAVLRS